MIYYHSYMLDFAGGKQTTDYPADEKKVDVDMWELNDGTKSICCINEKGVLIVLGRIRIVMFTVENLPILRMSWKEVKQKTHELTKRPWWLYGMS